MVGIVSVADLAKNLENCPECLSDLASELGKAVQQAPATVAPKSNNDDILYQDLRGRC